MNPLVPAVLRPSPTGQRSRFRRLVAGFTLLLLAPLQMGAQAGAGTIEGRVLNTVSGRYVVNARVSVVGSNLSVLTSEYGDYRIKGVPAGSVTVQVAYTGLDTETKVVQVASGSVANLDFELTDRATFGSQTIKLDAFIVQSERETNAAIIAANEQRNSANFKNVVSADAFGDVTEGNVGEFMKFLPGVTVDYVAADVRTMSVRGFADNFTSVSVNGSRMASAASGANSRAFEFEQVSINNVSRVELVKAPTPSMPADSLGGSVNLISKNAFERAKAEFKYRAYLSINSEDTQLFKKTPGPMGEPSYKVRPGFDFDYTLPVSKTFGLVVTGLSSNQFNEQHRSQTVWNHAQAGATPAQPYLQQYVFQDGPKNTYRDSVSLKADWKITPVSVLSGALQSNYYKSQFGNRNITFNAGTSATSTPSGGAGLAYDADSVSSAQGRAAVTGASSFRDKHGATTGGNLEWKYNGNLWDFHANGSLSHSRTWYRDTGRGHFSDMRTTMLGTNRLYFDNITDLRPGSIRVVNSTGATIDWTDLDNYRLDRGRGNPLDSSDWVTGFDADAKRELDFLSFPASLKIGYSFREQERDTNREDESWNFAGVNGSTNLGFALDTSYIHSPSFGLPTQEWPNPYLLYDLFKSNPAAFAQTATQARDAERFRRQNSYKIRETITALFGQLEAKLLDNRMTFIGGVRMEKTKDYGLGSKTIGPATTLDEVNRNILRRGYETTNTYDDYYPSAHFMYNVSENLLLRFSYSRTLGRPDYSNILPLARINYNDITINDGANIDPETVIVNNVGLEPWTSDGFDLSGQYYFNKGGWFSAGVFQKNLKNFWGNVNRTVTQADITGLGLPGDTLGFDLRTSENIGDAKITGVEFDFNQRLTALGGWGRYFSIFANATKLNLDGPQSADFAKFIQKSASYGIDFSRRPFKISLKANYRGRQRLNAQTGGQYGSTNGFREYYKPRTFVDINAEYTLSRRYTFFASARNIFNQDQVLERYNDVTPAYARTYRTENFGVQVALGVKGSW